MEFFLPPDSSDEEACLITIASIARRYASKKLPFEMAEEFARDVVLSCLVNLRSGRRSTDITSLSVYVRRTVRRRAIGWTHRVSRRAVTAMCYSLPVPDCSYTWTPRDIVLEELQLLSFHARSLASLTNGCRRADRMVREQNAAYVIAEDALGLLRKAMCAPVLSTSGGENA